MSFVARVRRFLVFSRSAVHGPEKAGAAAPNKGLASAGGEAFSCEQAGAACATAQRATAPASAISQAGRTTAVRTASRGHIYTSGGIPRDSRAKAVQIRVRV